MFKLDYLEERIENVRRHVSLTEAKHYKNISVDERGLMHFESYNFMKSCYEHCWLDLLCDFDQVMNILVENRIEILKKESSNDK